MEQSELGASVTFIMVGSSKTFTKSQSKSQKCDGYVDKTTLSASERSNKEYDD